MKEDKGYGASARERLELTLTALLPAALGLLGPVTARAGRLSWLGPGLALPVGLGLCFLWRELGERDLPQGLEEAFGPFLGKACQFLYLLWALLLLTESARRYAARLMTTTEGEPVRWLYLLAALVLCLWLSRGTGAVLARTGKLFFLATGAVLALVLVLALPAVDWQNLWPPGGAELRGLLPGAGLCLSLSGYGIYALCLPRRPDSGLRSWPWAVWGCGVFAALLFIVVGAFGPALTLRMGEPFLYLLEGVQVPGAFQRGEAALVAALALSDVTLLALLTRGAVTLWKSLASGRRGGGLWVTLAFLAAGVLPAGMAGRWLPPGNLILGILLPAFSVFTRKLRKGKESRGTCSGDQKEK